MNQCFFVSDLHGKISRFENLFSKILSEKPEIVFIGGDLLPSSFENSWQKQTAHLDFIGGYLKQNLTNIKLRMVEQFPKILIIMGNDDPRFQEFSLLAISTSGLCEYIHNKQIKIAQYDIFGYNYVPPTPFQLKDWERYDVSRFVDPGCISPEEGARSIPISDVEARYSTSSDDLQKLTDSHPLENAIFLFHTPPYRTNLGRAALDDKVIDSVPLDVNIGSIAIKRFIESRQPYLTLHGHVHESYAITGNWSDKLGRTLMMSAAYDGEELMLIRFNLDDISAAFMDLI
ncbi:MAG: hypothetical protein K8S87_00780 [Planctomycetes bacterium]|nr:hypothetical protein [Planctomycetota bacterium]